MRRFLCTVLSLFSIGLLRAQPEFGWARQIGSSTGSLYIHSSATDLAGNLFSTGIILGTVDMDPGLGSFLLTDAGSGDMFVSKTDPSGNLLWAKQIGNNSYDEGNSLVPDAFGNIYITGLFTQDSTDFDPGTGTFYLGKDHNAKTFILKLDASGNFIWAEDLGPNSNMPSSIALDRSGNVLITGIFGEKVDFDPGIDTVYLTSVDNDIYIAKYTASGEYIWARQIHGNAMATRSYSIAADGEANVYLTGQLKGTTDFDPGVGLANLTATSFFGGHFILKLNAGGDFAWARIVNGNISPTGGDRAIRVDNAGNSYIIGWFEGTVDFDPGQGVENMINTTTQGGATYILKLDSEGDYLWAKQTADPGNGDDRALALDEVGNVYLAGTIFSNADFDPGSGEKILLTAKGRSFVARYDPDGNLHWAINFSNDSSTSGSLTINVDAIGNVYTTGYFSGTSDFDPGSNITELASNSIEDVFIHKLIPEVVSSQASIVAKPGFQVFPNPSIGTIHVQSKETGRYKLMNEMGLLVRSFATTQMGENATLTGLPAGIYFLKGDTEGIRETRKVVVIR